MFLLRWLTHIVERVEDLMMDLEAVSKKIHANSVAKGFYCDPVLLDKVMAKIALVHSECTEILEAIRKNHGPKAVNDEFADVFIRTLDLYAFLVELGYVNGGLQDAIEAKMAFNASRPILHGHKWG